MLKNNLKFCFCLAKPLLNANLKQLKHFPVTSLFYRTKAKKLIVKEFNENLPAERDDLLNVVTNFFNTSTGDSHLLLQSNGSISNTNTNQVENNLEMLKSFRISKAVIRENLHLVEMPDAMLRNKLQLLSKMKFEIIDHGVPFLNLPFPQFLDLYFQIKSERRKIPNGNRLYYISDKIKVDPAELAQKISERLFVYTMPFKKLENNLQILMDMNIKPEGILNDLWVLKYSPSSIQNRLSKVGDIGNKEKKTWMVRCSEPALDRTINIRKTSWELLGDKHTIKHYLTERLQCNPEIVEIMALKIPAITTIRVSKARDVLDYLFAKGYTTGDIIIVPRVLAHSLKTIRTRLDELNSVGINPKNLNILCKSKKVFKKYLESFISTSTLD